MPILIKGSGGGSAGCKTIVLDKENVSISENVVTLTLPLDNNCVPVAIWLFVRVSLQRINVGGTFGVYWNYSAVDAGDDNGYTGRNITENVYHDGDNLVITLTDNHDVISASTNSASIIEGCLTYKEG
jgi:hypothetical protein